MPNFEKFDYVLARCGSRNSLNNVSRQPAGSLYLGTIGEKKKEKTLERAANEKHPAKFARLRGFCAMLGPNAGICITNLSM